MRVKNGFCLFYRLGVSRCFEIIGPSERDCLSCRNVQLISDDGIACLSSCGDSHYQDGDECKPCHENCSNLKCTGPGDHLGDGGCTECLYALMSRDHKVVRCLAAPSINEACRDVVGYYPSTQHVDGVQLVVRSEVMNFCTRTLHCKHLVDGHETYSQE
ncbi:unnamed protein product [Nippostrongylus brasiliensis]|uniref:Laminin EGF-like domain-containing protein n=1 Tax=Nippostrongylus brasiliensis TaxID=27835 RepID=A0A0N4XSP5_NIPBR|nr:unnamed protein product [Nippostrongylus brasiliensis]